MHVCEELLRNIKDEYLHKKIIVFEIHNNLSSAFLKYKLLKLIIHFNQIEKSTRINFGLQILFIFELLSCQVGVDFYIVLISMFLYSRISKITVQMTF